MMRLKRPRPVAFVEPESLFEQLEERIVLDATVDQVQVDTTNVPEGGQADATEDSATVVDAHCAAEDTGEATYTLTVDGKPVETYNSENGDAADIDLATDDFAQTGKFTWQPNNLDVGTHTFVITADDGAGETDDFSFEIVVNNVLPEFDSPFEITFIEDVAGQDFTIQLTQEEQGAQYSFDETDPNVQTLDGWLTLGQDSGILSCTVGEPDDSRVGTYVIDIYVHDGSGSSVGHQYTLIVENAIDFNSANSDTTGEDDPWTYDVQTDAENREGHSMTYWLEGAPTWIDVTDPSAGVLSGTPGVDDVGDTTFTIWARDNVALEESSQTFTITVTEENYFYGDTSTSVVEDTELLFDVDTDNERDGGTVEYYFEGGSQVWDGWITIDRDTGVLTANPDNSHVGEYILPIRALSEGEEIAEDFTVTVENAQPAFLNVETDVYMTQSSGTQTFDVETDDEGVSLAGGYSIASMVSLGTGLAVDPASVGLVIDADTGIISWDPQNADVDTYTIVVQFDDGNSPNGTATKEFNLQATNKVNVFTSQDATTWFEDEANQTFDVNTEEEGDGDITYSLGAAAPTWIEIDPATGELRPVATLEDGAPDNSHVTLDTPLQFEIIMTERHPGQADVVRTQTFSLTVLNTRPDIVPETIYANEGTTTVYDTQLTDPEPTDPDAPDGAVEWSILDTAALPAGVVSIDSSTGQVTITDPSDADVGTYAFRIKIVDGNGGEDTALFWLTIENTAPEWETVPTVPTVQEDDSITVTVRASDHGYGTYSIVSGPAWATIDPTTGEITLTPDDSWSETQADNNITVRFTDIHGESAGDIVLEVTVTNNDTVFVDSDTGLELADTYVHEVTFYEDQGYQSFDVTATDEAQGTSWYEIIVDPTWPSDILDWLAIDATTGLVYTTGDGPENAQVSEDGAWEFTIRHHDSHGSTDDLAVKITVVNDSPEFVATSDIWFSLDGGEQSFDLHTTDETSDNEGADPTGLSNQYDFSSVDPAFDGTIDIDAHSGVITLSSAPSAAGDYSFTVRFFDGTEEIFLPVTIHVTDDTSHTSNPPNSNYPNFLSDDEATFQEDEGVQYFDVEYQYEGQSGHTVTYSIVNNPNSDEIHIDPTTGEIYWEDSSGDGPKNEDVTYWPGDTPEDQPYEFTVRVTDNGTDYNLDFKLYVANADPWWTHAPGPTDYLITLTFTEDSTASVPTSIDVGNTDEGHRDDATESVYTLLNNTGGTTLPVGLEGIRIDQYTGVISWDPTNLPDNDDIAHYLANIAEYQNLQIVFDDGHGGVLIDYVDIVLENSLTIVGDAPNWQEDYDEQGGSAYSFDIDTDDDSLYPDQADKYELVSGPSWLQIDSETGLVTSVAGFVPDNSHVGQHSFTVSATDGNGTVTRTFTFTIENRDPVFLETVLTVTEDSNPTPINYDTDDDTPLNDGRYLLYRIEDPTGLTDWLSMDPLTGYITLDPTNEHVGTYEFDIYVQDRNADYSSGANDGETIQHVTLIVENDPVLFEDVDYTDPADPTIHGSATEDSLFTQDLNSNDESDGDTFYSMASDPDAEFVDGFWVWNGWVRLDPETGLISANPTNEHVTWDPNTSTHTPHEILITVDDGNGSTHTVTYSLTVDNVDPVWQNPPTTTATWTITEDIPDQVYNLLADDEEQHNTSMGTTVTYMADPDPAAPEWPSWLTLTDAEEGILEAHVNNSHVGTHTVWLIQDDGNGGQTRLVLEIVVQNAKPLFETPNQLYWVEDDGSTNPDIDTTDEPYDRTGLGYYLKYEGDPTLEAGEIAAPEWLEIADAKTGELCVKDGYTVNSDGSPDNSLVQSENYEFTVFFDDGTVTVTRDFKLRILNDETEIDPSVSDPYTYTENVESTIDPSAHDEYPSADYGADYAGQDYYVLYIDWNDQDTTDWSTMLDSNERSLTKSENLLQQLLDPLWDIDEYNSQNDNWTDDNSNDIVMIDAETGEFSWKPFSGDVPYIEVAGEKRHEFVLVHYDGHGSFDIDSFFVYVTNETPTWESDLPTEWNLIEDDTSSNSTLDEDNFDSDEETVADYENTLNYELLISKTWDGVGTPDATDTTTWLTWTAGFTVNVNGGEVEFDVNTGEIRWVTNNADVTIDVDNDLNESPARDPYWFMIRGVDDVGADTGWHWFQVTVKNTATVIPSVPAVTSVTEDVEYVFDFAATDEDTELPETDPDFSDAVYTLKIYDGVDTTPGDPNDPPDSSSFVDLTTYFGSNGLRSDDLTFDTETGVFSWTPNHSDTLHTNDYWFEVTHDDGHGWIETKYYKFTVENRPPDVSFPVDNTWILTEDSSVNTPLIITSDDDPHASTSFKFYIYSPGVDLDGQAWIDVDEDGILEEFEKDWEAVGDYSVTGTGIRPNGDDGGLLAYDSSKHELSWLTTNEDGTYNEDGTAGTPYRMVVVSTDGYAENNPSWKGFYVEVINADTVFTNAPDSDPANPQTTSQGVELHIDDASIETNDEYDDQGLDFPADDYYELWIDNNDQSADNSSGLILWTDWVSETGGSPITFDTKTGEITWTPNNLDVPDELDYSGTYYHHEFIVVHFDGHGDDATTSFFVEITNVPPTITVTDPNTYPLQEDVDTLTFEDGDVESSEEGEGLTYVLQIWRDDNNDNIVQEDEWHTINHNDQINTDGGLFDLNGDDADPTDDFALTGAFTWTPTNADVTIDETGTTVRDPWTFRITGNDGTPESTGDPWVSNPYEFDVSVTNYEPTILPATEVGGTVADPIPDLTIQEDRDDSGGDSLVADVDSDDEEVESTSYAMDAFYTMVVRDGTEVYSFNDTDGYAYRVNTDGGIITLDRNTGEIRWIPNELDVEGVTSKQYEFEVTHHDGNLGTDTETFLVTVTNSAPDWESGSGSAKVLVEDSHEIPDTSGYTFDMNTDQEAILAANGVDLIDLVDYELYVYVGSTLPTEESALWGSAIDPAGVQLNGSDSGTLSIDPDTGLVTWTVTNADANYEIGDTVNPIDADQRYWFKVVATDSGGMTSNQMFEVKVENVETEITAVDLTGVAGGPVTINVSYPSSDLVTVYAPDATEDTKMTINMTANDEQVETEESYWRDSYYTLDVAKITGPDPVTYSFTVGSNPPDPADPLTWQQTGGGLDDGGLIIFQQDDGTIEWTPNNRDVGTWEFRFVHVDGNGDTDSVTVVVEVTNTSPSLSNPDTWELREYPQPTPSGETVDDDLTDHPLQDSDWIIPTGSIVSDDEGLGLTYELQINLYGIWTDVDVDPSTVPELSGYDPAVWKALQPNGEDGGWLLINTETGRIEWQTTNADVTHNEDGSIALKVDPNDPTSADRGPYELRIRAQDSWGEYNELTDYPSDPDPDGWQQIEVTVLNRDTCIHTSTIDDSAVTEDVERTFNIDAYDEEVEKGTTVVTEYVLQVWADPDGSGPQAEQYISSTDYNLLTLDPTSPYYGRAQVSFVSEGTDAGYFSWMPNDLDAVAGHLDFRVYHDDGNLSVPYEDFTLTVTNEPPAFDPGTNDTKLLIEDSTNSAYYEIDINTDDESEGGVDYRVWFQVSDSTAPDASSTSWIEITGSGYVLNALINGNGTITFDENTGIIIWHTTNADVNYAADGVTVIDDNYHYWIKVKATDTLGGTTDTVEDPPAIFEVRVQNVKTDIDEVEYTDLNGDTQVQSIPEGQDPSTPIVLSPAEAEDTPFYLDFGATDEEHESGAYAQDSYYVIHVTGPGGIDYTFSPSNADPYTPFEAGSGLLAGGTMTYNKDTGVIQWDPNNRDVGTWSFEVTHYDDRGTSDTVTLQVEVANNAPEWIAAPTEWHLVEDDDIYPGLPDDWTLDDALVKADDEGLGQTYSLTIDGQAFDTTWSGVVADGDWLRGAVNGSEGGVLEFNTLTGEIIWRTTNADVTGAVGSSKPPYEFVLTATDSHGDSTSSPAFLVSVDNEPTVIDSVLRIDGDPDDGYAKEKEAAIFDPHATDEGTDRAASAGRDGVTTYYTLQVDDGTGTVDWQYYNDHNGARGDVDYFNTATGEFSWTPDNLDTDKTYTFILTHHDDNGGQDSENVVLTVLNTDPYFTAFPTQWTLHEDDTNPADYTLDQSEIQTDQEGLALRYTLYIDGVEWTPGYAPNGSDGGGVIQYFDTVTGEIQWSTTNADITIDQDGSRNRPAYEFKIVANDQHGGVIEQTFAVDVTNEPTSINDVPDQHVVEDEIALEIGDNEVTARDEGVGGGFYTLEVQRLNSDGSATAFVTVDAYNAANAAGADIAFDSQMGAIHWETTNRDVGDYVFRITHDDTHGSTATDTFAVRVENTAPVFTTAAPGPNFQLPPTFSMSYDPLTSDEGQHDCRGDDQVIYSLVEAPPGMTIDPMTGLVSWTAPPSLAGQTMEVIIRVDDGNGGVAFQRFTVEVLNPVKDMPWEMRAPESDFRTTGQGEGPEPGRPFQGHDIHRSSLPSEPSPELLPRDFFEETLKAESGLEDLLKRLAEATRLEQPSLEHGGITDIPTGLYGFLEDGLKGRRLDFNLDEIQAWTDLVQPSLPHGGSQSPETPLEGYAPQVEAGSRLNFDFFPIKEAVAIKLDDLKAADLLGV